MNKGTRVVDCFVSTFVTSNSSNILEINLLIPAFRLIFFMEHREFYSVIGSCETWVLFLYFYLMQGVTSLASTLVSTLARTQNFPKN